MFEKSEKKDKKRIKISDLLKAYKDGLTIQEIMDKTGLARHTVLARLHRLEGEKKVRMRQVNMAKMYYWNESEAELLTKKEAEEEFHRIIENEKNFLSKEDFFIKQIFI